MYKPTLVLAALLLSLSAPAFADSANDGGGAVRHSAGSDSSTGEPAPAPYSPGSSEGASTGTAGETGSAASGNSAGHDAIGGPESPKITSSPNATLPGANK